MDNVKYITKLISGEDLYYLKDTEARTNLIDKTEKGVAGGVATLDNSGKVPSSQLPESYASVSKLTVGETEYNPIDGNITIPAYPTTLPASDVSAWAKSDTKPSYTKSEIGLDNVTNDALVKRSEMGVAEGVATLDTAGKIPSSQLPSYVDDVLEYADKSSFPATGETGKIYVDTSTNLSWRWGGTTYVEISPSLALGETSSTAYAGDKGKALADKLAGIESGAQVHKAPTTAEVKSALGTGSGTSKYLREDGSWLTPPDNNTTYSAGSGLSLSGTTFSLSLTKELVTTALGYTPPTSDTNTVTSINGKTGAIAASDIATVLTGAGYKLTDTTYNFSGTSFTSNNSSGVNANDVAYNAHTYYTSNGPATSLGASTTDGALYTQAYSTTWAAQIAQDYRNGGLYVRGKNNGTWQSWYKVWDSRNLTNLNQLSNGPGYITGINKTMVVDALGYTPPTSDTNTWRPLGTGANDACAGNDSRLSNARPASDVYSWAKASSKPSYSWSEISSKPFNWNGQSGQPSWLWGSNDGTNYYVWNPSNFNVNYASSANYANSAGALSGVQFLSGNMTTVSYTNADGDTRYASYVSMTEEEARKVISFQYMVTNQGGGFDGNVGCIFFSKNGWGYAKKYISGGLTITNAWFHLWGAGNPGAVTYKMLKLT